MDHNQQQYYDFIPQQPIGQQQQQHSMNVAAAPFLPQQFQAPLPHQQFQAPLPAQQFQAPQPAQQFQAPQPPPFNAQFAQSVPNQTWAQAPAMAQPPPQYIVITQPAQQAQPVPPQQQQNNGGGQQQHNNNGGGTVQQQNNGSGQQQQQPSCCRNLRADVARLQRQLNGATNAIQGLQANINTLFDLVEANASNANNNRPAHRRGTRGGQVRFNQQPQQQQQQQQIPAPGQPPIPPHLAANQGFVPPPPPPPPQPQNQVYGPVPPPPNQPEGGNGTPL